MIIYGNYTEAGPNGSLKNDILIEKTTRTIYYKNTEKELITEEIRKDDKPNPVQGILRALHVTREDIPDNFCIIQEGYNDVLNNHDNRYYELFLKNHKITFYNERTAIEYFKILCTDFPDDETVMSEKYSMLAI